MNGKAQIKVADEDRARAGRFDCICGEECGTCDSIRLRKELTLLVFFAPAEYFKQVRRIANPPYKLRKI
jgi:hypothetical protein